MIAEFAARLVAEHQIRSPSLRENHGKQHERAWCGAITGTRWGLIPQRNFGFVLPNCILQSLNLTCCGSRSIVGLLAISLRKRRICLFILQELQSWID